MKTPGLNLLLFGGALFLLLNGESKALPPIQHLMAGRIVAVDYDAQTFSVLAPNGRTQEFVWNESTRFSARGHSLCKCALQIGGQTKLFYRREVGRLVGRDVSFRAASTICCGSSNKDSTTLHGLWTR
jgi:hypothetical protein